MWIKKFLKWPILPPFIPFLWAPNYVPNNGEFRINMNKFVSENNHSTTLYYNENTIFFKEVGSEIIIIFFKGVFTTFFVNL